MSEYDKFEKLFCGTWKHDRDEGLEEVMNHLKSPEEEKEMTRKMKPTVIYKRQGNTILQTVEIAPGMGITDTLEFGKAYLSEDSATPKRWSVKCFPTFDGTVMKQVMTSQMPPPKNTNYMSLNTVNGDELINAISAVDDTSVVGKRIFKRV